MLSKIYFTAMLVTGSLIVTGCQKTLTKSTSEIEAESRQLVEEKLKEEGDSTKIIDYDLGRVTDYKFEGSMKFDNGYTFDVVAYYDPADKDGRILVKWVQQNAFSKFLK
jgi:hypothetical protein